MTLENHHIFGTEFEREISHEYVTTIYITYIDWTSTITDHQCTCALFCYFIVVQCVLALSLDISKVAYFGNTDILMVILFVLKKLI